MKTIRERLFDIQLAVETAISTTRLKWQRWCGPTEAWRLLDEETLRCLRLRHSEWLRLRRPRYSLWVGLYKMEVWAHDPRSWELKYAGQVWEDETRSRLGTVLRFLHWPTWATILMLLPLLLVLWSSG